VTGNHTISATFAIKTYTITTTAGTGGSITPANPTVSYGGSQTITISPNTGYDIVNVVVDSVSQGAITSYDFTNVTGNHTISATFAIKTYTITTTAGTGGSITPANPTVSYGDSPTFTITQGDGYIIEDVVVDGASQGPVPSYQFTNVTANHAISATFIASP
jgi:hypothetical protein